MRNKGFLYLAMGDSITWLKPNGTNPITHGADFYNMKIRNYIRSSSIGSCRLINKGIGASTSADMVQNLTWVSSLEPDLVTIGIGTNDVVGGISTTQYQTNIGIVIDRLKSQNPNVKIVLCTPPRTLDSTRNATIQTFRDAMVSIAATKNVNYVRWETAWTSTDDATNINSDNLHPTVAGHLALYNSLLTSVKGLFGI
jgi:lysophospholipase L1-like esterase